jgi:tricorn protease
MYRCGILASLLLVSAVCAQEPIRFTRTPDLSPDGRHVAFSYQGDIWLVESTGGVARPITIHEAHDIYPCFSPDGKWLAFSSTRFGGYDVFVVPVQGGKPRRLTFDSTSDFVTGWSPDGQSVLFASARGTAYPQSIEMYSVPVVGGAETRLAVREAKEGLYAPRGDVFAFVRGPGLWYRKNYRGSSNDDIWLTTKDAQNYVRITDFNGQDTSPMWSADGKRLYYVSEKFGGPANLVVQELTSATPLPALAGPAKPVTQHKDDSVRRARISGNGERIVYECGADLWVHDLKTNTGRKLAIEAYADDKSNIDKLETLTSASEFALSADEKFAVVVAKGELFMLPFPTGGKPTRLTDTPANDHGAVWAPDGKSIIFASDRNGHEDLYRLTADDPETTDFTKATKFKVAPLTNTPDAELGVSFSPDGKRIAFLRASKLWTMNADGTNAKVIVPDVQVFDYDWSPDGRWFVYARSDGSFASELYVIPSAGGLPRNITRYATYNAGVTWSSQGHKLSFLSQRDGQAGAYVLSLQRPSTTAAGASSDFDWDGVHLRVERAAPVSARECVISTDGKQVALSGMGDLWVANADGSSMSRVTSGGLNPAQIRWAKSATRAGMVYFLDGTGTIRMVRAGTPSVPPGLAALLGGSSPSPAPIGGSRFADSSPFGASEPAKVPFSAKVMSQRQEEYSEIFDQSWRALSENFYDDQFHGADWKAVRAKYRPLVKHITQREDLNALISLMLGELNASHLGITPPFGTRMEREEVTPDLGIVFDETFAGPGLKVVNVVKRGPADKRGINLNPGDVVVSLDKQPLTDKTNVAKLLNGKIGETIVLEVAVPAGPEKDAKPGKRKVEVPAVDRGRIAPLQYEAWVQANAERVNELSGGTLGYIHIPSMDDEGLSKFVRALYSDNFTKEGIVLDVRFNGGGFTHDMVLSYLSGKEHTFFRQRDGGEGTVIRSTDRKFNRPLTVLINNRSYSDAEIFPWAFKAQGLGKVVGQATGGFVIGTTGIRLIDGSTFRIPRTGVFTTAGVNMEKEGVQPDVPVEPTPLDVLQGKDPQLAKAVEVLKTDVANWKNARTKPKVTFGPGAPIAPAAAPMGGGKQ